MTKKVTGGELDARTMLYTELRKKGGDPSFLFELLEGIIERREWESLKGEDGRPVGSLRRLIEAPLPTGCGQDVEKVRALLKIEHRHERNSAEWKERMRRLKEAVETELESPLPAHGEIGRNRVDSINSKEKTIGGTSTDYTTRRLMRDRPELGTAVLAGKMSANEAAIVAGFRKKKIQVYPEDPESTARLLVKHMTADALEELQVWLDKLA